VHWGKLRSLDLCVMLCPLWLTQLGLYSDSPDFGSSELWISMFQPSLTSIREGIILKVGTFDTKRA